MGLMIHGQAGAGSREVAINEADLIQVTRTQRKTAEPHRFREVAMTVLVFVASLLAAMALGHAAGLFFDWCRVLP
jgi:hypothetical protein